MFLLQRAGQRQEHTWSMRATARLSSSRLTPKPPEAPPISLWYCSCNRWATAASSRLAEEEGCHEGLSPQSGTPLHHRKHTSAVHTCLPHQPERTRHALQVSTSPQAGSLFVAVYEIILIAVVCKEKGSSATQYSS